MVVLLSAGTELFTDSCSGLTVAELPAFCRTDVPGNVLLESVDDRTAADPVVVLLAVLLSLLADADVGTLLFHLVE